MGCIDYDECGYVFNAQCMTDPDCEPIGQNYLHVCDPILNGSLTTGDCPYDCLVGLTAYLDYMWPDIDSTTVSDYCECSPSNEDCDSIAGIIHYLYVICYNNHLNSVSIISNKRFIAKYGMY